MMENRINLKDGLIKQNMVFMSGMLIAPVIACTNTLMKSLAICFVFSLVSFLAIVFCRYIPRTIVYTVRITLYSLAAAVFYIPVASLAHIIFGEITIASTGVYLPILITNSLILSKTETRFYHEPEKNMLIDVLGFIIGFDIACAATGLVREYLASGNIAGTEMPALFTVPALETTFGGFIFIGIGAGVFRAIYNYSKNHADDTDDDDETLAEYAEDMGEFLVGRKKTEKEHVKDKEKEAVKIYKTVSKKKKGTEELLEMEFLSNKDVIAAFENIIAEGREIQPDDDYGIGNDEEGDEDDDIT